MNSSGKMASGRVGWVMQDLPTISLAEAGYCGDRSGTDEHHVDLARL
jgi:hypothetical protein